MGHRLMVSEVGGSSLLWAGDIPRRAGLGCIRKAAELEPWGKPEGSIALWFRPLLLLVFLP